MWAHFKCPEKEICCLRNCVHSLTSLPLFKPSLLLLFSILLSQFYMHSSLFIFFHHTSVFEICLSILLISLSFNSLSLSLSSSSLSCNHRKAGRAASRQETHSTMTLWGGLVCTGRNMTDLPGGEGCSKGHRRSRHGNTSPSLPFTAVDPLKSPHVCVCVFMFFSDHDVDSIPVVIHYTAPSLGHTVLD